MTFETLFSDTVFSESFWAQLEIGEGLIGPKNDISNSAVQGLSNTVYHCIALAGEEERKRTQCEGI